MTSTKKDPVIVVLQLTGGNDYFNTVIPYNDSLYYDNRPGRPLPARGHHPRQRRARLRPHHGPHEGAL